MSSSQQNDDVDDDESKSREGTPPVFDKQFDPFDVIAITGSYLGSQAQLNQIKRISISNDANDNSSDIDNKTDADKSYEHIHRFNAFQSKRYSKLNKSLNKKLSSSSNLHRMDNNKSNVANIWDRQYSSFCIAKNVSYKSILNYAHSMYKNNANDDDDKENMDNIDKKCDVIIKCGGCYAVNSMKTSSFCDGYILPKNKDKNDDNEYIKLFKLPNLEIARSNCSSIYHTDLGIIVYGGRMGNGQKSILSRFEVLNIENNDIEWDLNVIPPTKESRSRHPSIGIYDNKLLFICGGRGVTSMNQCEILDISNIKNKNDKLKWKNINCMNYSRSFGSNIINSMSNESIILMGGYGSFHAEYYAERYDINKNKWIPYSKCNYAHKYNPCIKLLNNDNLLIVICDKRTKSNLGVIEILDVRTNKWMKMSVTADQLIQLDKKQELRRLMHYN